MDALIKKLKLEWKPEWKPGGINSEAIEFAESTFGKFLIRAEIALDDCPDLSYLGKFSDTPEEGAILHAPEDSRTFKYFNPENPEYAKEDYKRMLAYERGEWYFTLISVTVRCAGTNIVLGESNGGNMDSDSLLSDNKDAEVLWFIDEAVSAAKENLSKLIKFHKRED